ncbi:Alpha/Beta hydrolase fold [Naviculisporaceae sp. PSN 640]
MEKTFYPTTFRTIDGTELRGRVYPSTNPGPGVVMCPGFNCTLSMLNFPQLASTLQQVLNITVLLYDPRTTGSSSGSPRNQINPPQSVSDLSDALTHLSHLPSVSVSKGLGLLGFSLGGTVSLTCSVVDPRVVFTIAIAPLTDMNFITPKHRRSTLQQCARDRESQVLGNQAYTVPVINEKGENPVGFGHKDSFTDDQKQVYGDLVRQGRELAPGHVNRVTLGTYYMLAIWTPWPLWRQLGAEGSWLKGVMFVVPGEDGMSYPALQRQRFEEIAAAGVSGDEKLFVGKLLQVDGAGHEDVMGEKYLGRIIGAITDFLRDIGIVDDNDGDLI